MAHIWTANHIQDVNNFLVIKGDQLFKSVNSSDRIYRACYALPSDPAEMDDWASKHLQEGEAIELYSHIFS